MRRLLLIGSVVLIWSFAPEVHAAERIRVLLFQNIPRTVVQGDRGIVLRFANGEERSFKGAVNIAATADGMLMISGRKVRTSTVQVRGRGRDLTLMAVSSPSLPHKPSEARDRSPGSDVLTVGGVVLIANRGGALAVVNALDVEEYVKGVVPSEMNAAWHPEALKAQAVATRTYALYQRMLNTDREYDLVASVQDQVYRGRHGVDARVERAVDATRGMILTYNNAPILAAFSSTAAGPTEDAMNVWAKDLPYLKGVDCPFDANSPYYGWRAKFTLEELERSLRADGVPVGTVATLTPYTYSRAGRVDKIRILHSKGELMIRGQDLRRIVGYSVIPSTQFEVEAIGRDVVLTGRGAGHAVGLCQWGAKELAEQGYPFLTILKYYFPGTQLRHVRSIGRSANPAH